MIMVKVQPGICGLPTEIHGDSEDGQNVTLSFVSSCPAIEAMGESLKTVDGYAASFAKFSESPIYQAAEKNFKHAACPVPMAVVKTVEAVCGLALPKDVEVSIERV